jgi:hypothetical protein
VRTLEVIELCDQLVDALRDVLSPLVRLEEPSFERPDVPVLFLDPASQRPLVLLRAAIRPREARHRALESLEVVALFAAARNENTPVRRNPTCDL